VDGTVRPPKPSVISGRKRLLFWAIAVLAALLAYEGVTSVVAYTADAYVRSDLVSIAPEVSGRITAVHVRDNQAVRRGDPLVTIDPVPFQLTVDERRAMLQETYAQVAADTDGMLVAQSTLDAATDALTLAEATKQRVDALGFSGDISRQRVDEMTAEVGRAQSNLLSAKNSVAQAGQILLMHQAAVSRGTAELASAAWRLSRTAITAPGDGTINNLAVRIGDMARADVPLIGIVDAHAWRIMANYRQTYIRQFYVGQTAWVWLDSEPGRFYRARIEGVGRGISRDPVGDSLLAFAVIIVWEKFSDAERTVAQEAGAAATLYRLADGIGGEPGAALRSSLTHYVKSAVTEGWPAMERGEASRAVTRTLDATYVALLTFAPNDGRGTALLAEALHQLDLVTQARRARLAMTAGIVPRVVWFVLVGGAVLTIGFTLFFGTENLRVQAMMTGVLSFLIFSGVLVIITIDHPFAGSVKVGPEALAAMLEDFGTASKP